MRTQIFKAVCLARYLAYEPTGKHCDQVCMSYRFVFNEWDAAIRVLGGYAPLSSLLSDHEMFKESLHSLSPLMIKECARTLVYRFAEKGFRSRIR